MANKVANLSIENAHIMFRNFSGEARSRFDREGVRYFYLVIDDEDLREQLVRDGWNVKEYVSKNRDGDPIPYIKVEVNYNNIPPKIYQDGANGPMLMSAESIGVLDDADIENVDLTVTPYSWEVNGKTGIKAYLKSMFVTFARDAFAEKHGLV